MNKPTRLVLMALGIILTLHFILSISHQEYGRATSVSNIASKFNHRPDLSNTNIETGVKSDNDQLSVRHANATFVILARNNDLDNILRSIRDMEDRFNRKYRYPYVFLNEVEFSEEFKARVSNIISTKAEFGLIPHDHWYQPDWIDEEKATAGRNKMAADRIIYGDSVSYRNMCRYNSGFFFRHELLQKYNWYWRIEPDVHFHCDLNYDPFLFMQDNNKTYGFTITMYEFEATIPTLWGHVKDFMKENPQYVAENNAMGYMSDNGGENYNLCHFWSNFEIASMDFWRSEAYMKYFEYLDTKGGFYYERWGDAPVHSIAAGLFNSKDQIHFFHDIGYEHNPYIHCPADNNVWSANNCACDQKRSFDYDGYSCMRQWDRIMGK